VECTFNLEVDRPGGAASAPAPAASTPTADFSFHEVLSALNPLQYVPVVGSIYRALTGDSPPEPVRMIGSIIFSVLTGGPVGAVIDVAEIALEKATGIDPDKIVHSLMASMGMVGDQTPAAVASAGAPRAAAAAYAQSAGLLGGRA
jgi:hypothetical protein